MLEKNYHIEALGTNRTISYAGDSCHYSSVKKIIEAFEASYSRFLSCSFVSELNKKKQITASKEFADILRIGYQAYKKTHGIFSPFVGSSLERLGYDSDYSFQEKDSGKAAQSVFSLQGEKVKIGADTSIDIGGYGKGYLIDLIADYFLAHNIRHRIVNGGGDIRFQRENEKRKKTISIPHPQNARLSIAERQCLSGSIASSSSLVRKRGKHHHLIDPKKGSPTDNQILSLSVFATHACLADIAATTLFVGGENSLLKLSKSLGVSYIAVLKNNIIRYSPGIIGLTVFDS